MRFVLQVDKEDDENPEESYDSDVAIEGGGSTCSSLPDKLSSTSTITNQVPAPAAVVYVPPSDIQLIDRVSSIINRYLCAIYVNAKLYTRRMIHIFMYRMGNDETIKIKKYPDF